MLSSKRGRSSAQEAPRGRGTAALGPHSRRDCGTGHGAFSKRSGATGTKKLMQFAGRKHQQQSFSNRLSAAAFRAIKLAGGKIPKLLRHGLSVALVWTVFKST